MWNYIYVNYFKRNECNVNEQKTKREFFNEKQDKGFIDSSYIVYKINNIDLKKYLKTNESDGIKEKKIMDLHYINTKITRMLFNKFRPFLIYYNDIGDIYIIFDDKIKLNGCNEYIITSRIVSTYTNYINKYKSETVYLGLLDTSNVYLTKKSINNKNNIIEYIKLKQQDNKNNIKQICKTINNKYRYGNILKKYECSEMILNMNLNNAEFNNIELNNKLIVCNNIIDEINL
jgi:hypothetical protein